MAERMPFNPQLPDDNIQNYLGYSRGAKSGLDAIGTALSEKADLLDKEITAAYKTTKQFAQEDVTKAVDSVQASMLGLSPVPQGAGQDPAANDEVVRRGERLAQLTDAVKAGKIKESHYWTLLDSEVRQIRAKYPGMREEIDNMVQSMTGAIPANKMINELFHEARAGISPEEKEYNQWEKHAIDVGVGGDLMQRKAAGKPASLDELKFRVSVFQKEKAEGEIARQAIADKKASGEVYKSDVERVARGEVNNLIDRTILSATGPATALNEAIKRGQANAGAGGSMNPEDQMAIRQAFGQLENTISQQVNALMTRQTPEGLRYATELDEKQRKDIMDMVGQRLQPYRDNVLSKDYGLLGLDALRIETTKSADASKVLASEPAMRMVQVMKELAGPQWAQISVLTREENLRGVTRLMHQDTMMKILGGAKVDAPEFSISKDFQDKRAAGTMTPEYARATINKTLDALKMPDAPAEIVSNSAGALFTKDFLFSKDAKGNAVPNFSDPYRVYQQIAGDPVLADNMLKIKDTNPQVYQKYREFVIGNFATMNQQIANDAQSVVVDSKFQDLQWNPETLSFSLVQRQPYPNEANNTPLEMYQRGIVDPRSQRAVDALNKSIAGIANLIRKEGNDPTEQIMAMLKATPIDTSKTKVGPGATTLWEKMVNGIYESDQRIAPTGPGSKAGARPKDVASLLDFIGSPESGRHGYNAIWSSKKGGESAPVTEMTISEAIAFQGARVAEGNPSSAIGKYQFMRPTLTRIANKLGLDPNTTFMSPDVQDRMATELLRERGLDQFLSGTMPKEKFLDSLAKEWAALPTASGKSHYDDGSGLNKAGVSRQVAEKFLDQFLKENGTKYLEGRIVRDNNGRRLIRQNGQWVPYDTQSIQVPDTAPFSNYGVR